MVLTALAGALGFLTRLPVGRSERAWEAFRTTPAAVPLAGYVAGVLVALPVVASTLVGLPEPTTALVYLLAVVAVTGINHFDGVADLGDAAVIHGDSDDRRGVMKDTTVGVGAAVAVGLTLLALALAVLALARLPPLVAVGLVVTGEVAAKLGMAALGCFGSATHDGLGSQLSRPSSPGSFVLPLAVALPAAVLTWPHPAAGVGLLAGLAVTFGVLRWARKILGGVSGDVFGAANEIARIVALHAGVIAWTLL